MSLPHLALLTLSVFGGATLGTFLMRRLAVRYGWMVLPRADRWHKQPTARYGGVGFYPVFLLGAAWILGRQYGGGWHLLVGGPHDRRLAVFLLLGSLVMFGCGLWDDVQPLRPATKLLWQLVAASLFVYAGGGFPLTHVQIFDILVTYFWFVGITNAVNLLDNMDGLASGVVMVAVATVAVLAASAEGLVSTQVLAVPLGVAFIAALLGFWLHNRPPAAIFMGDCGSLCIGYLLAALAVPSSLNGFMGTRTVEDVLRPVLALLIPATVVAIPIFDTTLVTLTRTWRAQKASQGGQDHSSHRLVGLGLSEKRAVGVLYVMAAFGGLTAVSMQWYPAQSLPLFGLFSLILALMGAYLGPVKMQVVDVGQAPPAWTPLVSNLLYKRHAAQVLLDVVLIIMCFYGAYLLRFEGILPPPTTHAMLQALPLVVSSCLLACFSAGIYGGLWRLLSVSELPRYAVGVGSGTALSLAVVTLVTRFDHGHSRSAYMIFGMLLYLAMVGSRLSFRLLDALFLRRRAWDVATQHEPVLIYGAGRAGKLLYEESAFHPQMRGHVVVGFIDDDPHRVGRKLCGIPVKDGWAWSRQAWGRLPEIWVSSQLITDERARQVAAQWPEKVAVHRLQVHMEPVSDDDVTSSAMVLSRSREGKESLTGQPS
jgi:UDP-GlcNAc:undecaprenyl-phosphate/decaprenyl-phosphate GlcNAc-1-phosphate transferase